jgi:CDP-paratose 2-epimerase
MKDILVTGGAGFVGAQLALRFKKQFPQARITALDNLKRRGSELNLAVLKQHGIAFVHGDIRVPEDLSSLVSTTKRFDLLIEASAEPSVHAGSDGSPAYVLQTNLNGTLNCLEFARRHVERMVFLSTSRVYSLSPLRNLKLKEGAVRLDAESTQPSPGASERGLSENFPTDSARTFYGMTKLASEMAIQEYAGTYGLQAAVFRCGVIAGAGQFGKVDQGVYTLWMARHLFGGALGYTGFGGTGKQVRDLLHPDDLHTALSLALENASVWKGDALNLGGGLKHSVSLQEWTQLAQELTGKTLKLGMKSETAPADIPWYVSDCSKAEKTLKWKPTKSPREISGDIVSWLKQNESALKPLFQE